ncbi:MAG: hypothetical protein ABIQ40_05800 [Bacteroidia bacterium]
MEFGIGNNVELFVWGELYYIELEVELGINALTTLNSNQEKSLLQSKAEFEKQIKNDSELQQIEREFVGSYYSQMYERDELFIKELQRQQRYAILMSLFSFFEARLKSVCVLIEEGFKFKIKLSDLRSNDDLMRYWIYLDKVFEMKVLNILPVFNQINLHKKVRNKIAHQNGLINEGEKNGFGNIQNIKFDKMGIHYQIEILNEEYLTKIMTLMVSFFAQLLTAVDERYKEIEL